MFCTGIGFHRKLPKPGTRSECRRNTCPHGLTKIEEIRALFRIDHVSQAFREKYGRDYNENDIQSCYAEFQRLLFSTLRNYSGPIAHVVETIDTLRGMGILIGSTTGYTQEMMDIVIPSAAEQGYKVDNCVTSDNLPAGRPAPYMIYKNMCGPRHSFPLLGIEIRRYDFRHQGRRERRRMERGSHLGKQRAGTDRRRSAKQCPKKN